MPPLYYYVIIRGLERERLLDAIKVMNIRISDRVHMEAQSERIFLKDIIKLLLEREIPITEQLILRHPIRRPYPIVIVTGKISNEFLIHSAWAYNKENKWAVLLTINQIKAKYLYSLYKRRGKMIPFQTCPVCGGYVIEKNVEELIKGGNNTAILEVRTEVCLHCGERFYSQDLINKFENVRKKLENDQTTDFTLLGKTYLVY